MATVAKFTDRYLDALKITGREFEVSEASGLRCFVKQSKSLGYRYRRPPGTPNAGKPAKLIFGRYPSPVSLAEGRTRWAAAEDLRLRGIDPGAAKQTAKAEAKAKASDTFQAIAERWLKREGRKLRAADRVAYDLKMYLYPRIGSVMRVVVLRDPALAAGIGQFAAIQALAPASLGAELTPIDVRDPGEIERAIGAFARERNGGLIVTGSQSAVAHRDLIISLATRYRLPNVFGFRYYAAAGGLASYGPDPIHAHKRAAGYVDRILKGEKPADLPVQAPTKYALVINLKTAKALGLTVPASLLARADELIE